MKTRQTHQDLRDSANAVCRGKFISLSSFIWHKNDPNQYFNIPPEV